MVLTKKCVVQKTFRFEQVLEEDLYLLSELTNRTQNELVSNAIESYMLENKEWFASNMIVEHYAPIFDYTGEEYSPVFKMQGLTVELIDADGFYKIHYTLVQEGVQVEDYVKKISISDSNAEIQLKEYLRYLTSFLDFECDDVQDYLKKRLDYRDYK